MKTFLDELVSFLLRARSYDGESVAEIMEVSVDSAMQVLQGERLPSLLEVHKLARDLCSPGEEAAFLQLHAYAVAAVFRRRSGEQLTLGQMQYADFFRGKADVDK